MIEDLFLIEKHAYRDSPIHRLDARAKIVLTLSVIVALVAVPYTTIVYTVGLVFLAFFIVLWAFSGLSLKVYLGRLLVIVPLWGVIILFQIFLKNGYYTEYHPILLLPLGIAVYAESVQFASIVFVKFFLCISFVILLSSTSKVHDLLEGAGRLGLPAEFALTLGMMIRYLFVFGWMYRKISESLATRCFDPFDRSLPYRYRIRQIGYHVGSLFLRSYEQGERTYTAMLCRGYGRNSHLFLRKKPLPRRDWAFLSCSMAFVVAVPVIICFGTIPGL
ncbi:MAG: cobalt ECF transporter T component CbiQ [Methanoregulaceae archaeon]|nr:cobalt ECF transporter T component CbiQ [Methanoregulaceae archaeon]